MRQSKLFKDNIITVLQIGLTISMLGCAVGEDDASRGEAADRAGTLGQAEQPVNLSALAASGTWFEGPDEFCVDFFPNTGCFPPSTPQCDSTVVDGQSCTPVGTYCFKLITSRKFHEFDCLE